MKAQLTVVQGKPEGKQVPVSVSRFLIGRGEDCHLRPNSELVSRHHCVLIDYGEMLCIRDLGSTNGTKVNKEKIHGEVELKSGDLIEVGPLVFRLVLVPEPKAAAKPVAAKPSEGEAIASWLAAGASDEVPERPSGVYSGDTTTLPAVKSEDTGEIPVSDDTVTSRPAPKRSIAPPPASSEKSPSRRAEEIIKKYLERRPG